jgi:hypothetical protein
MLWQVSSLFAAVAQQCMQNKLRAHKQQQGLPAQIYQTVPTISASILWLLDLPLHNTLPLEVLLLYIPRLPVIPKLYNICDLSTAVSTN